MIPTLKAPRFGQGLFGQKSKLTPEQSQDLQSRYAVLFTTPTTPLDQVQALIVQQAGKATDPPANGLLKLGQVQPDVDGLYTLAREKLSWRSPVRRGLKQLRNRLHVLNFLYEHLEHALKEASFANKYGRIFENLLTHRTRDLVGGIIELGEGFGGLTQKALDQLKGLHQTYGTRSQWLPADEQKKPLPFETVYLHQPPPEDTPAATGTDPAVTTDPSTATGTEAATATGTETPTLGGSETPAATDSHPPAELTEAVSETVAPPLQQTDTLTGSLEVSQKDS